MKQKAIGNIKKDRLLRKCEGLMLRGTDSPTDISRELKISFNTAKSYILTIKTRWTDSKSMEELQGKREELIRKTEEIIRESWKLKDNARNTLEAVGALRTALQAIERLQKLTGLDSLPLPTQKHTELQIFEYAKEIHALPENQKTIALKMIKKEITERNKSNSNVATQ